MTGSWIGGRKWHSYLRLSIQLEITKYGLYVRQHFVNNVKCLKSDNVLRLCRKMNLSSSDKHAEVFKNKAPQCLKLILKWFSRKQFRERNKCGQMLMTDQSTIHSTSLWVLNFSIQKARKKR